MTRDEFIVLVTRVCNGEGETADGNALLQQAIDTTPNGGLSDLIYWRKQPMTPEEIVDEALRRSAEFRRIQV